MKKITKILLATDFSEDSYNAYKYALQLIADMKVNMEVIHVIPTVFEPIGLPVIDNLSMMTTLGDAVLQMKSFVQRGITELDSSEVNFYEKIQTNVEIGDPVKTIQRIVKRDSINLTIVGRRGESDKKVNALGSVSIALLNKLECDLFIIPSNSTYNAIKKVGFATEYQKEDPYLIWKTKEIFQKENIEFDYVHISNENGERSKLDQIKEYCQDNMNDIAIEFSTIKSNNVAKSLVSYANQADINVLVFPKKNKSTFQRLFTKSTTKEVLRLSEFPMLVLKGDESHL